MRSNKLTLILILCQYCVYTCSQISKKFFRNDYTYFESTQSFYKVHTLSQTWLNARRICATEGASLFYPKDKKEADLMTGSIQTIEWIYVGASDLLAKGIFETIDGEPLSNTFCKWAPGNPGVGHAQNCVYLRKSDGTFHTNHCDNKNSFVCKKTLCSLQWNEPCNMPLMDYEYNEATGRCYKIHLQPLSWSDAHATCNAELSYQAVINSPLEAEVLVNLTANAAKDQVAGTNCEENAVHLGFQKFIFDEGWLTVNGIPLSKSGYSRWADGEPNNTVDEKCGSMFYNGKLNDVGCQKQCFFICEHNVVTESKAQSDCENMTIGQPIY